MNPPIDLSRRTLLRGSLATLGTATLAATGASMIDASSAEAAGQPTSTRQIRFHAFEGARLASGAHQGTTLRGFGVLEIDRRGTTSLDFTDPITKASRRYDAGEWTSPMVSVGFGATQVIASWNAETPTGTVVETLVQGRTASGATTEWYVMGRWTSGDTANDIRRQSVDGQKDAYASVSTDTLMVQAADPVTHITLKVRLWRLSGTSATPRLRLAGWVASAISGDVPSVSTPIRTGLGHTVSVPTYSQMEHQGHYPQYNNGGEAWCSATSTTMVLDRWNAGPRGAVLDWVTVKPENRPQVDHVARCVYDYTYEGTGNWPFNTAYAGARGLRSYVTRLHDLNDVQRFIAAGIPLVTSQSFTRAELPEAGYGTHGHLMVVVGFTSTGDVVVNDPASHLKNDDSLVRNVYPRAAFEHVWLRSGGVVYVMAPPGRPLPLPSSQQPAWV